LRKFFVYSETWSEMGGGIIHHWLWGWTPLRARRSTRLLTDFCCKQAGRICNTGRSHYFAFSMRSTAIWSCASHARTPQTFDVYMCTNACTSACLSKRHVLRERWSQKEVLGF